MHARWIAIALTGFGVGFAVLGFHAFGWLEPAELLFYDRFSRLTAQPVRSDGAPVVLLEITEQDLSQLQEWPISDRTLSKALSKVLEANPRVVGFDLYRNFAHPPGSDRFERLMRDDPRLVGVFKFVGGDGQAIPGPPALESNGRVGFSDLLPDPDGAIRRGFLYLDDGADGPIESSFALVLALTALRHDGIIPAPDPIEPSHLRLGNTTLAPFHRNDGGYRNADDGGYQILLDYHTGIGNLPTYTLGDLLEGRVAPEALADRVVILGSNAESTLGDIFITPLGEHVPGMEIHGHAVDQLIRFAHGNSAPRTTVSESIEAAVVLLVALGGGILGLGIPGRASRSLTAWFVSVTAGLLALWAIGALVFASGGWVPVAAPSLAWLGTVGGVTAWASRRERAAREQLQELFAARTSPEVLDHIWENRKTLVREGRLRPQRLVASVLFVDMRGYTVQAGKMDPEDLVTWSTAFLDGVATCIRDHGGYVDDYFGDGIKAAFGVPVPRTTEAEFDEDARQAIACGLAITKKLHELNAHYRNEGLPECAARVGIATGTVVASDIGVADKLKYTVVGDVVVTAQRLEATREIEHDFDRQPCRVLISSATYERAGQGFACEATGAIALPGLETPVEAWRAFGVK